MDVPRRFEQRGRWRRFLNPAVEADYREWHRGEILPVARIVAALSALAWATNPLWFSLVVDDMPPGLLAISYRVAMPTLLIALLLSYSPFVRWFIPVIVVANIVIGLCFIVTFGRLFGHYSGMVTAGALSAVFYPLIMRLPTVPTATVTVVVAGTPAGVLIDGYLNGDVSAKESLSSVSLLLTMVPIAIVAAAQIEASMRKQFASSTLLEATQRLIRRYVPSAVAARIESGDPGAVGVPQRLRVTAFSSDLAGFTVMADRLDPESLSQIISEYVGVMSEVVEGQGGVVTEFAGDGLMAIFGAPEQAEPVDQVRQALAAAQGMHQRLADLNATWFHLGIEQPLKVRIGINTGVLSVGTFGSDGRGTYTAIGLQMNIAARIQAQCEPGSTLLSSSSWHLVKDQISSEPLGEVDVKGVHFPISVYAPDQT
jgi:class 3 adenylate cyclase